MSFEELSAWVGKDGWNFAAWTKLLGLVEAEAGIHPERIEPTFDGFLSKFPLCFGYWWKYAKLRPQAEIYERAVDAVPLSAELWKNYLEFQSGAAVETRRELFERALDAVGHDKDAGALWDAYFDFEATHGTPETVCRVYRRVLRVDGTGRVDEFWHRFKLLCRAYKTSEILSLEEAATYLEHYKGVKTLEAEDDEERAKLEKMAGFSDLEEQRQMEQMLRETEQEKNALVATRLARQKYEAGIRRWYFHAKPLDEAQLQNWRDYLAAEIHDAGDDVKRFPAVQLLFERCLIPCAFYAEFWLAYALWAQHRLNNDEALAIIARASTKYLPKRIDILETLAHFLELVDRIDDARQIHLAVFDKTKRENPKLRCAAAVSRANFERRQHNYSAALDAYRDVLVLESDPDRDFVATHCARFQVRVLRDLDAARRTLDTALRKSPGNKQLWIGRVQLEMMQLNDERFSVVRDNVVAVYERAIASDSPLDDTAKVDLWSRYLYFLENYHDSITAVVDLRRRLADFRRERSFDSARRPFAPQFPPIDAPQAPDFWDEDVSMATNGHPRLP